MNVNLFSLDQVIWVTLHWYFMFPFSKKQIIFPDPSVIDFILYSPRSIIVDISITL